jgi:hypothetical protein
MKHAKYCINVAQDISEDAFTCSICLSNFSSQSNLHRHNISCSNHVGYVKYKQLYTDICCENKVLLKQIDDSKNMYEKQIEDLKLMYEKQINLLQRNLQELSLKAIERPTNATINNNPTHNTNILNIGIYSPEELIETLSNTPLNKTLLHKGPEGVAEWVGPKLKDKNGKPTHIVADASRKKLKYKDEQGVIQTDSHSVKLIKKIQPVVTSQTNIIIKKSVNALEIKERLLKLEKMIKELRDQIKENEESQTYMREGSRQYMCLDEKIECSRERINEYIEEQKLLKQTAEENEIPIDLPYEYFIDDHAKTCEKAQVVKHLTDHNTPFTNELVKHI